jgi:polar amino acid transport system substrate-binding protein
MKLFFTTVRIGLFVLTTLIFAATAIGQTTALERIQTSGVIKVGVSGTQPPYSLMSNSDELIGFEIDMAHLLAESMKVDLELVQLPFAKLLDGLESGKVDVVMSGMTINAERNMRVLFAGPYNVSGKTILTKSASLSSLDSESEAGQAEVSVAALEGSTSESYARTYFPNATIVATSNYDQAVDMLLNDDVKAMLADIEICQVTMLKFPGKDLAILNKPLTIEPIGIAIPATDYQLMNLVENYFSKLEMVGALEALREKWFKDGTWLLQAK